MTTKQFESYGIAGRKFSSGWEYIMSCYAKKDETTPSTPIIFDDNIFNSEILKSKNICDYGCGMGRNLKSIMDLNDVVHYHGIDPNVSMKEFFWDMQDKQQYEDRVSLYSQFEEIPKNIKFDVVLSTFVFQHLGYRNAPNQMNSTEFFQELLKFCDDNTIFIFFEHETEEPGWQARFFEENNILPQVYIKSYTGFTELNDRGTDHNLIIWRKNR